MIADETYGGQKNPNFAENVMELLNFAQRLVRGN
jgi:hypothetical protein